MNWSKDVAIGDGLFMWGTDLLSKYIKANENQISHCQKGPTNMEREKTRIRLELEVLVWYTLIVFSVCRRIQLCVCVYVCVCSNEHT